MKKSIIIALAGEPNVGKSTLLNKFIGHKLAIMTPKIQTTRMNLRGIKNVDDTQLVLIDTPGLFETQGRNNLEKMIVKNAWNGIADSDIVMLIFDCSNILNMRNEQKEELKNIVNKIKTRYKDKKIVTVVNKVDLIEKNLNAKLFAALEGLDFDERKKYIFDALKINLGEDIFTKATKLFFVSAYNGDGIANLVQYLAEEACHDGWIFGEDMYTDSSERQIAEEMTREQVYLMLSKELPYSIKVETDKWTEEADGSVRIDQSIIVLKESQKKIIIGSEGKMIKRIGEKARKEIANVLNKNVHLFLFIKVRENWIKKIK